jgi:hypothetical protein
LENIDADYVAKTVTFHAYWQAGSRNNTHLDSIWVFVDFQPVTDPVTTGLWQRALVVHNSASASSGRVIYDGSNRQGFWLKAPDKSSAFSSIVTVQLSNVPNKFNWCVYVSDYPPNADIKADGSYVLHGTAPFVINSYPLTPAGASTYSGDPDIMSLTDATGCPGVWDSPCKPGQIGYAKTTLP